METASIGLQEILAGVLLAQMAINGGVQAWKWYKNRSKHDDDRHKDE